MALTDKNASAFTAKRSIISGRIRFHLADESGLVGLSSSSVSAETAATSSQSVAPIIREKPFVQVQLPPPRHGTGGGGDSIETLATQLATFIVQEWRVPAPDIIISICSGIRNSYSMQKDANRYALQRGFSRIFSTASVWIFTFGYNHGISKLIGDAVRLEQERRSHTVLRRGGRELGPPRLYNRKIPKIVVFGVALCSLLRDNGRQFICEQTLATPAGDRIVDYSLAAETDIAQQQSSTSSFRGYDLNPYHTHFIIINDSGSDYLRAINLRVQLERELHLFAHKYSNTNAQQSIEVVKKDFYEDDEKDGDELEQRRISWDGPPLVYRGDITSDDEVGTTITKVGSTIRNDETTTPTVLSQKRRLPPQTISIVSLFVQGGPLQLDQILWYLKAEIPCIVMKGSGLMADVVAGVYDELSLTDEQNTSNNAQSSTSSIDLNRRVMKNRYAPSTLYDRPDIVQRLRQQFTVELPTNKTAELCYERLTEILRRAQQNGRKFLSIVNLQQMAGGGVITSEGDEQSAELDRFVLKALFKSQDVGEMLSNVTTHGGDRAYELQLRNDLLLTIKWNYAGLARAHIFQSDAVADWGGFRNDRAMFEQCLLLSGREAFVDMFLEHGFRVHRFLSHRQLLTLFRRAEDTEFFQSVIFWGILDHEPGEVVHERFVINELNPLINQMTSLPQFIDAGKLSANAYGLENNSAAVQRDKTVVIARRRALLALLVWCITLNRFELAVIVWKYCDHPIATALFASRFYTKLSKLCTEPELVELLYRHGKAFSQFAIDILDLGYNDGGVFAFNILETRLPEFDNKTIVLMAYTSKNRWFLSHPCCQKWIERLYKGRIDITKRHHLGYFGRILPQSLKIILSSWFVLPMFVWIRFPREQQQQQMASQPSSSSVTTVMTNDDSEKRSKNSDGSDDDEQHVDDEMALYGDHLDGTSSPHAGLSGISDAAMQTWRHIYSSKSHHWFNKLIIGTNKTSNTKTFSGVGNGVAHVNGSFNHDVPAADQSSSVALRHERELGELRFLAHEQQRAHARGLAIIKTFNTAPAVIQQIFSPTPYSSAESNDLSFFSKWYYLNQAPCTKFYSQIFASILFLVLYSIAAFNPDCDQRFSFQLSNARVVRYDTFSFVLDAIVWLWAALNVVEYALRTVRQYKMGVPLRIGRRCIETVLLTLGLTAYILIRSISFAYQFFPTFIPRVIMLVGLLYYAFSAVTLYFPISRELGPFLVRVKVMITSALINFLKLVLPFMLAYMVIIQVAMYPDKPLTWATLGQAALRAVLSFFMTTHAYLEMRTESAKCAAKRISQQSSVLLFGTNKTQQTDGNNQCLAGDYYDVDCPTANFWSYFFLLQWLFIFNLVLMSLLVAFFTSATLRVKEDSEKIWRLQRFQLVMNISTCSALPPPFALLSHLVWFLRHAAWHWLHGRRARYPRAWNSVESKRSTTAYWQMMVRQFWRDREAAQQETQKIKSDRQYAVTMAIKAELDATKNLVKRIRTKLSAEPDNERK